MVRITDHLLRQAQQHQKAGDWLAAAAAYAELAARYPRDHRVLANQGNALWLADLPAAAHQAYARALAIEPTCPITRRGLASCLRDLNQFEAALALHQQLERSLDSVSEQGLANLWAHSQVLIGLERFGEAFARMALRSPSSGLELQRPWNPLAPELTLTSEQGFGDTLQFVRFLIPLLTRREHFGLRGGVRLLVEPPLVELLHESLAWLVDAPTVSPNPRLTLASRPSPSWIYRVFWGYNTFLRSARTRPISGPPPGGFAPCVPLHGSRWDWCGWPAGPATIPSACASFTSVPCRSRSSGAW